MKYVLEFMNHGSARRFLAFLLVLILLACSHYLGLGSDAITAITTLALGYIGQGTVKAIMDAKVAPVSGEVADPKPAIGFHTQE